VAVVAVAVAWVADVAVEEAKAGGARTMMILVNAN
jgi:hypothetical protein